MHSKLRCGNKYDAIWQALSEQELIEGKIVRIDTIRNFVIIQSVLPPCITFYGRILDFVPRLDVIPDDSLNKIVTFSPKEIITDKGPNKVANYIKFKK